MSFVINENNRYHTKLVSAMQNNDHTRNYFGITGECMFYNKKVRVVIRLVLNIAI